MDWMLEFGKLCTTPRRDSRELASLIPASKFFRQWNEVNQSETAIGILNDSAIDRLDGWVLWYEIEKFRKIRHQRSADLKRIAALLDYFLDKPDRSERSSPLYKEVSTQAAWERQLQGQHFDVSINDSQLGIVFSNHHEVSHYLIEEIENLFEHATFEQFFIAIDRVLRERVNVKTKRVFRDPKRANRIFRIKTTRDHILGFSVLTGNPPPHSNEWAKRTLSPQHVVDFRNAELKDAFVRRRRDRGDFPNSVRTRYPATYIGSSTRDLKDHRSCEIVAGYQRNRSDYAMEKFARKVRYPSGPKVAHYVPLGRSFRSKYVAIGATKIDVNERRIG